METLGQRIKRLREGRGLSQQEVAGKVGVSRVAVTKWESGDTANLKLGNLLSLCDLFGIGAEDLVRGPKPGAPLKLVEPGQTSARAFPDDMSDLVRKIAMDIMQLPRAKQLEIKAWAALELNLAAQRQSLAESKREEDHGNS